MTDDDRDFFIDAFFTWVNQYEEMFSMFDALPPWVKNSESDRVWDEYEKRYPDSLEVNEYNKNLEEVRQYLTGNTYDV